MNGECLKYRNAIPDYMEDRLPVRELEAFLLHLQHCDACREELTTQYLMSRGWKLLESDEPFDLNREMEELKERRSQQLRSRRTGSLAAVILEIGAVIAFILEVVLLIRL